MTSTPAGDDRGIHVSGHGTFDGIAQTGDGSTAEYIGHAASGASDEEESDEIARLRQAVEDLRLAVRALGPDELPSAEEEAVEAALAQVDDVPSPADEAGQGRVRNSVFLVTGALASVASLSESIRALRDAASPWF
ncbi:DUF5955 family protein [Streptomyces sp. NPDC005794]|uniref:DUF5955 family protein n=1 Tax=Streptomyces sp. NPDC005794 TaxID=3364733 RepID=UPI00367C38D3